MSQENHEARIAALESRLKQMAEALMLQTKLNTMMLESALAQDRGTNSILEIIRNLVPEDLRGQVDKITGRQIHNLDVLEAEIDRLKSQLPPDQQGK